MFNSKKTTYILYGLIFIISFLIIGYDSRIFNDYVWHIKAGQWMIENKEILTHNIFSYIIPENTVWYSHEWLSEVIMYLNLKLFKIDFAFFAINISLIIITLLSVMKKDLIKKDLLSTIFISILIFISIINSLYARPFLYGLIFFIILIKSLDDIRNLKDSKLYLFLPIISILWANMHGGTILFAVFAPIGYYICGKFRFMNKRLYSIKSTKIQNKKYLYLIIGNFIGSLINPFIYKIYLFPLYINNSISKDNVVEWSPASIEWPITIISIIFICLFLIFNSKKVNFTDFAVIGGFILLTLIYGRFYSWLIFAFIIIFLKYFKNNKKEEKKKMFSFELKCFGIVFLIILISIICFKPLPKPESFMSPEIVENIKEVSPERLFNSYDAGGVLNYFDIKCFINPIAELYGTDELSCGKYLQNLNINFVECFKYYDFDYLLVEKNTPLYLLLKTDTKHYELIYEDLETEQDSYIKLYSLYKSN